MTIHNAFSPHYVSEISLKAENRETQLHAKTKAEREKLVLSENYNHIHVTSQAESDESRRKAGRHIRG